MFREIFVRISGSEICVSRYLPTFPELLAVFPDSNRDLGRNVYKVDTLAKRVYVEYPSRARSRQMPFGELSAGEKPQRLHLHPPLCTGKCVRFVNDRCRAK